MRAVTRVLMTSFTLMFTLVALLLPLTGAGEAIAASGWQPQLWGTTDVLRGVSAVDANTAWAVGYGAILKTTDGGSTWVAQLPTGNYMAMGVVAVNKDVAWVYGADSGLTNPTSVYKTIDGGATWQLNYQLPSSMYCVGMAAAGTGTAWLSAHQDINFWFNSTNYSYSITNILKTVDGGASWTTQYSSGLSAAGHPYGAMGPEQRVHPEDNRRGQLVETVRFSAQPLLGFRDRYPERLGRR
jgi:hypothetical protein